MSADTANTKQSKYMSLLVNAWILIPVFVYFNLINTYAQNIPMKDDYDAVLGFLNHFRDASFSEKIQLLFSQHNEHRIFASRLVYAIYYIITGTANFKSFAIIANLQLAAAFLVFAYIIKQLGIKYWNVVALIAGFCIMDHSSYENGIMAMAGMQNFGVVALFMLTLYFYSKDSKQALVLGGVFQFLTIYSSGNGMIAAFFIMLYCLLCGTKLQKITSAAILLVFAPLYFVGYAQPARPAGHTFDLGVVINYFLSMAGSHFAFGETTNTENANVVGAFFLILTFALLPYSKTMFRDKKLMLLLTVLAFMLASMATTALFRANLGTELYYSSRYLIYSHFFIAIALVVVTLRFKEKQTIFWPALGIFAIIVLSAYKNNYAYGEANYEKESNRMLYMPYYYPGPHENAQKIADESCKNGIYCLQDEK